MHRRCGRGHDTFPDRCGEQWCVYIGPRTSWDVDVHEVAAVPCAGGSHRGGAGIRVAAVREDGQTSGAPEHDGQARTQVVCELADRRLPIGGRCQQVAHSACDDSSPGDLVGGGHGAEQQICSPPPSSKWT